MKIIMPERVSFIISRLKDHGFDAYAVGGCVRDSLLGRVPNDWDITTDAKPEQVKEIFGKTIDTGIQHGTVTVMIGGEGFEVTTYRIDGEYTDGRHPDEVSFTSDLLEDLRRRDFTINAMAYNDEVGIVDAFGGVEDLEKHLIKCVGSPEERFGEDALRMLRALRFAAQLGFSIDPSTYEAIVLLKDTLDRISAERIQVELVKLVTSNHPEMMRHVYETGIASVIMPELCVMMETPQNNPHHLYTVGEHSIRAMMQVEPDKILRLTMLLHDVAKPATRTTDDKGIDHFYGHPEKGVEMAKIILRRLKFDNDTISRVCGLIKAHDDRPQISMKNVRRSVNRYGESIYPQLFAVKRADVLAQSMYYREEKLAFVDDYEAAYNEIIEKQQCLSAKDLNIDGRILIEMGIQPGPILGETLKMLLDMVIDTPELNEIDTLKNIVLDKQKLN